MSATCSDATLFFELMSLARLILAFIAAHIYCCNNSLSRISRSCVSIHRILQWSPQENLGVLNLDLVLASEYSAFYPSIREYFLDWYHISNIFHGESQISRQRYVLGQNALWCFYIQNVSAINRGELQFLLNKVTVLYSLGLHLKGVHLYYIL